MSVKHTSNNFDFLRFIAAIMVLCSHSFPLLGQGELLGAFTHHTISLSSIAVFTFFIISGYLISQSFDNDPNVIRYFAKRLLRIMPGLIVVVFFAAFIIGPIFTSLPLNEYLQNKETLSYLLTSFIYPTHYSLPGLFETNPHPGINGSLWTLSIEFTMYILVAIVGTLTRNKHIRTSLLSLCLIFAMYHAAYGKKHIIAHMNSKDLANFAIYFIEGALIYLYRDKLQFKPLISITIFLLFLFLPGPLKKYSVMFGLAYIVLNIAFYPIPKVNNFARFGDFSYGIYIYSFPVQESLIHLFPEIGVLKLTIYTIFITMIFAYLSWHVIEKPAMSLKRFLPD